MHADQMLISRRNIIIAGTACSGMLLFGNPLLAFADPSHAEKQAEAEAVFAQLTQMQDSLNNAESNYHNALEEQDTAKKKMEEAQTKIDELNAQMSDTQSKLSKRARNMYRNGSSSIIDLLLGATTFKEFATNWDLLNQINQNDSDMIQESKDLSKQLEEEKANYAEQEKLAGEKAEEAKSVKDNAQATIESMQAIYDGLSSEIAALVQQEAEAQEAENAAKADQVIEEAAVEAKNWYETINANNNANNNTNTTTPTENVDNTNQDDVYDDTTYDDNQNTYQEPENTVKEPSYDVSTGNAVVDRAYSWVGIADYEWGACSPGLFDCSGFVSYCLSGSYSRLGSTSTFLSWPRVSDPQPGDVCVNDGHCGIYIGGGQMIHAPTYGYKVSVSAVQSGMIFVRY